MGRPEVNGATKAKPLFQRRVANPSALRPLARSFSPYLKPGTIVVLTGSLGTGKTTFVKALCRELGVPAKEVRSPSFTLINEYVGNLPVFHIDLYRIGDCTELPGLGLDEILEENGICFIEWPHAMLAGMEKRGIESYKIEISFTGRGNERLFTIWAP